jgi:hypothetical protein
MRYNWGYSAWVIESWNRASQAHGWHQRAQQIRNNILDCIKKSKEK